VVAPSGRTPRDRDDEKTRGAQALERFIRDGQELSAGRERVVDVGEDAANRASRLAREFGEGLQAATVERLRRCRATASRSAAVMCSPHFVRRQRTSSAVCAHSSATK